MLIPPVPDRSSFKLAVLVSGRGSNLQAIINAVERRELQATIALVASNRAEAPALDRAKAHGIDTVFLDPKLHSGRDAYDRALADLLRSRAIDLICLAGFMRILSREFVRAFAGKIINVHPSLLPAFPGLDAQKQALAYGAKCSGCTVHFVDEGVDSGPIILQAAVPVQDGDDEDSLSRRILEQEHILYPQAIQLILENRLTVAGRRVLRKHD